MLIEATDNLNIDNMEGIAAHRSNSGETILTVISDDNFQSAAADVADAVHAARREVGRRRA